VLIFAPSFVEPSPNVVMAVAAEKSLAVRRQNWSGRQWRTSENGNAFTNVRGFNIVVFGSRKGWGIKVEQRYGERLQFGKQRFETAAEAKARAFDALIWAERAWGGNGRWN
jgi:hypothetical protein